MARNRRPATLAALACREHLPLDLLIRLADRSGLRGAHASMRVTAAQAEELLRDARATRGGGR